MNDMMTSSVCVASQTGPETSRSLQEEASKMCSGQWAGLECEPLIAVCG
jgi:hypothetical protein